MLVILLLLPCGKQVPYEGQGHSQQFPCHTCRRNLQNTLLTLLARVCRAHDRLPGLRVIPLLAGVACGCGNPPQALLDQFGAVQYQVQDDKSLCMEFTIYSGNPNATAADIVGALEDDPPTDLVVRTKRPKKFLSACKDDDNGCIGADVDSDGNSMIFIIIGAAAACVLLALGIVWFFIIHKRVDQRFRARTRVTADADEAVTVHVEPRTSTAWEK
jgi:hypothetical protein